MTLEPGKNAQVITEEERQIQENEIPTSTSTTQSSGPAAPTVNPLIEDEEDEGDTEENSDNNTTSGSKKSSSKKPSSTKPNSQKGSKTNSRPTSKRDNV